MKPPFKSVRHSLQDHKICKTPARRDFRGIYCQKSATFPLVRIPRASRCFAFPPQGDGGATGGGEGRRKHPIDIRLPPNSPSSQNTSGPAPLSASIHTAASAGLDQNSKIIHFTKKVNAIALPTF